MLKRCATKTIPALVLVVSLAACATSSPERPAARAATAIEKVYPADFDTLWQATRVSLKADPRLALHTIDRAGRFIAKERSSGFVFFRERTIFDIKIERQPDDQSSLILKATAEKYDFGGLSRRADWYPSDEINMGLAREIVEGIESHLAELNQ